MSFRFSFTRIAFAVLVLGAPALARAQDMPASAPEKLPTAAELRVNRTTGYGAQTRGGQYLNAPGAAGSIGLSNTEAEMKSAAKAGTGTAVFGMGGATGTPGYGRQSAGAATAFHHLPEPAPEVDLLTPQVRASRAILPGAHQPIVGGQ